MEFGLIWEKGFCVEMGLDMGQDESEWVGSKHENRCTQDALCNATDGPLKLEIHVPLKIFRMS